MPRSPAAPVSPSPHPSPTAGRGQPYARPRRIAPGWLVLAVLSILCSRVEPAQAQPAPPFPQPPPASPSAPNLPTLPSPPTVTEEPTVPTTTPSAQPAPTQPAGKPRPPLTRLRLGIGIPLIVVGGVAMVLGVTHMIVPVFVSPADRPSLVTSGCVDRGVYVPCVADRYGVGGTLLGLGTAAALAGTSVLIRWPW